MAYTNKCVACLITLWERSQSLHIFFFFGRDEYKECLDSGLVNRCQCITLFDNYQETIKTCNRKSKDFSHNNRVNSFLMVRDPPPPSASLYFSSYFLYFMRCWSIITQYQQEEMVISCGFFDYCTLLKFWANFRCFCGDFYTQNYEF